MIMPFSEKSNQRVEPAVFEDELILEQKNAKSAGGATPEIMALQGRRLAVASETEENRRVSPAKVKRLTGSDTLTGRAPLWKEEV